eukprot:7282308-Pyramimonas_sp.AAC.1
MLWPGAIQDRQDAAVTVIRGVEVPGMGFLQFRIFERWFSKGALPSVHVNPCKGICRGSLGGRVACNIVDESWVCTVPPPSPPLLPPTLRPR